MDSPRHHISIQVVRYDNLSLRQRRNPWFYFSFMFECLSFFSQKVYIIPVGNQTDIPFTRINHNKYMVTDKAAYIG